MRMQRLEQWMMRSPLRRWMLRRLEAPRVLSGLDLPAGARVLEVGCGDGYGALVAGRRLSGAEIVGLDVDAAMLRAARRTLARPPRWAGAGPGAVAGRVRLVLGDATTLSFAEGTFQAALLFGVLHHIGDWRRAVAEVCRVLVPGGVFAFEEALLSARPWWLNRWWGHVPFEADEVRQALVEAGFEVRRFERGRFPPMCYALAVKPLAARVAAEPGMSG